MVMAMMGDSMVTVDKLMFQLLMPVDYILKR